MALVIFDKIYFRKGFETKIALYYNVSSDGVRITRSAILFS